MSVRTNAAANKRLIVTAAAAVANIHPTAMVSAAANLAADVRVGAGAVVEEGCDIGGGSVIGHYSTIWRDTVLGKNNRVFPYCSLGGEPQDKKYRGERAPLIIGDDNTIREYCFLNKGTAANGETRIGSRNWIMAYVHVAHDCVLGDDNIIANGAQLAGHVVIGNRTVVGGGVLFHQFRRVGDGAMIGGGERMRQDVPPYALCGEGVVSVNVEGMRRGGFDEDAIAAVRRAYRLLYRDGMPLAEAVMAMQKLALAEQSPLRELLDFIQLPDLKLLRPRRD